MLYQLPNGKVINISVEAYLRMSDDDLRYLNEGNFGSSVENENVFDVTDESAESIFVVDDYPLEEVPDEIELDELDLSDDEN